jgi:hypothetical protein
MIINQSVGFTFIHIPKSAGTSVTQFLSPLNGPLDLEIGGTVFGEQIQNPYALRYGLRKHSTLEEAWSAIQAAKSSHKMFFFTIVRNPFDRLLSTYRFLLKWDDYNPELRKMIHSFPNQKAFLESRIFLSLAGPDGMFRPQSTWLKLNGQRFSEMRVFKLEEINTALELVRQELLSRGAPTSKLQVSFPHVNKSTKAAEQEHDISESLYEEIVNFYAEDFKDFGYDRKIP